MMHLNKFVCYNPKFRSIDENESEKERGKGFLKVGVFFPPQRKSNAIQGKPTLFAILKLL